MVEKALPASTPKIPLNSPEKAGKHTQDLVLDLPWHTIVSFVYSTHPKADAEKSLKKRLTMYSHRSIFVV